MAKSVPFKDIWLRLWTDANRTDVEVNTGKYYGIYVLIAILTLIVIGLDTWLAMPNISLRSGVLTYLGSCLFKSFQSLGSNCITRSCGLS